MTLNGKILVIDDEPGIRAGCRRALEPQGFHVEVAANITEGRHKIQKTDFDLILLDVMMPDGRGIDLLADIRTRDPEIIVIIITGYATVELAVEAIKAGAYDFIAKPFTSDILLMAVNQGLEKRQLSLETQRLETIEAEAGKLAQAKEELELLDHFKSEFMRMVAHELRSPIGGAQSLLRTLLAGMVGELSPQQVDALSRVENRLASLKTLVDDLLFLASAKNLPESQELQPIELTKILATAADRYSVEAKDQGVHLNLTQSANPVFALGTRDGYAKIFSNLISNAVKYTPQGGEIQITLITDQAQIEIGFRDSGIGIPESALPNLGTEFFRAPNARHAEIPGTGLGLSIVLQLVAQFGGELSIESIEGQGSIFKLTFPLAEK